jgi:hypothetical protein
LIPKILFIITRGWQNRPGVAAGHILSYSKKKKKKKKKSSLVAVENGMTWNVVVKT